MATINLKGYDISFPYAVPYDIQKAYMEKVLTALDQKTHAVLESPTGTGKTLCLFAPVTAWVKRKKLETRRNGGQHEDFNMANYEGNDHWGNRRRIRVWYTARTHSQIAQTVGEVRRCNTDGLQVRVMGARDQLCINKTILEEKDSYVKTVKCKELVKNKGCKYYGKLSYEKDIHRYYENGKVLDIEDLVSVGKSCGVCPYYLAKKASESADIVLLPYNYIIESDSRESNGIQLQVCTMIKMSKKSDVIIFDEGHNVPSTCEEGFEFSFTALDIALGIRNIKDLMEILSKLSENSVEENEIDISEHASNSIFLMKVLQKLESGLEKLPVSKDLLPVSALHNFFETAGISHETSRQLLEGIHKFKLDSAALTLPGSTLETFKLLEKMTTVIYGSVVRSYDKDIIERSFKCGVTIDAERMNAKKLSLHCFNPSFGIKSLLQMGVQSIIITSGTLSPLKTFISELGIPNPVTLENGHIAKKCQVPFVILGTGVNNVKMDGSYNNRNDPSYISSLGMTLTNLISSIPDGILLLFSSYTMMQNLREAWESTGIWARLNSLKRVFLEPRNKDDFINCMENYRRAIDSGNGAILMGVLRGKISEGMDFKDQYCRGVFIIGVPFPPVKDQRVQGKEKYAESLTVVNPDTKALEKLYNNSFMSVEAMKTTNQAIGRVIRHGQDYGVIILVDYRFAWPRLFTNISGWLRGDAPIERNFPTAKKLVRDFFRDVHNGKLGVEEIRCQRVDSNGCPVASYVSYEEYDHKKHASQPVAWIGGNSEDKAPTQSKKDIRRARPRGNTNIEFIDEDDDDNNDNASSLQNLFAKYKSSSREMCTNTDRSDSGSLLDVLESSRSSSVGYREFDMNIENGKRKYEEDDHSSTPAFPFPEPNNRQKKLPRLKVRPVIRFDRDEEEEEESTSSTSEEKDAENLKIKLINFYKTVKQSLSKENDQKFKTISCKYMKGEAELKAVIESMDELFLSQGNKNLFSGFSICVKGKDRDEWMKACSTRNVTLS